MENGHDYFFLERGEGPGWLTFSQFTNELQIPLDLELQFSCKEVDELMESCPGRGTRGQGNVGMHLSGLHRHHACPIGHR